MSRVLKRPWRRHSFPVHLLQFLIELGAENKGEYVSQPISTCKKSEYQNGVMQLPLIP